MKGSLVLAKKIEKRDESRPKDNWGFKSSKYRKNSITNLKNRPIQKGKEIYKPLIFCYKNE